MGDKLYSRGVTFKSDDKDRGGEDDVDEVDEAVLRASRSSRAFAFSSATRQRSSIVS